MFAPEEVDLSGSIITIRGQRYGLTLDRKTQAIAPTPPSLAAFLRIDLGDKTSIPGTIEIVDQLFFNDVQSALAIVPDYLKPLVPPSVEVKGRKAAFCNPCTRWVRQGSWQEISTNDPGFKIEHVVNEFELQMTPAARAAHVHATASFAYTIDESGHTTDLWLLRAAGYGLDQSAVNTLKNLTFRPAMYRGAVAATIARSDCSFEQN